MLPHDILKNGGDFIARLKVYTTKLTVNERSKLEQSNPKQSNLQNYTQARPDLARPGRGKKNRSAPFPDSAYLCSLSSNCGQHC